MTDIKGLKETFVSTFVNHTPTYTKASKWNVTPDSPKIQWVAKRDRNRSLIPLQEIAAYKNIQHPITDQKIYQAVEDLAFHAACVVEGLLNIKKDNFEGIVSCPDKREFHAVDIFEYTDGSQNLNLMVVTDTPPSVADPEGLIHGWVSFKFKFACDYF